MKAKTFTVYIEQDEDGMFVGSIPSIPSCHAEGKTQEEMLKNLSQVLKLCIRNIDNKEEVEKHHFIGIQNLECSYA
ncbi:MAG: type II toxin-antitoxin system HicB family antitoxin [Candidatus Gracilibacteria bacterium]